MATCSSLLYPHDLQSLVVSNNSGTTHLSPGDLGVNRVTKRMLILVCVKEKIKSFSTAEEFASGQLFEQILLIFLGGSGFLREMALWVRMYISTPRQQILLCAPI